MIDPVISWDEEIKMTYTPKYGLTYGGLSVWPTPDLLPERIQPTVDETLPSHWPHWFTIRKDLFEVLEPTKHDVQFVLDAFGETHPFMDPEMFEEDRYGRFSMTYHAYHRIGDLFPGDKSSPTELSNNLCQKAVDIIFSGRNRALNDSQITRSILESFDIKELRTIMFRAVRSHRMASAQQSLMEYDSSLRLYLRAMLLMLERKI
jgi:hypothetical protein